MSLSIGAARASAYRGGFAIGGGRGRRMNAGDPGLFGFIGDAIGTVAKGVVGAATGFLSGGPLGAVGGGLSALGILKAKTPATTSGLPQINVRGITEGDLLGGPQNCAGLMIGGKCIGGSWGPGSAQVGVTPLGPMEPGTGMAPTAQGTAVCTVKGAHLNKSGYFTQGGYVPPQSKCVRNRRMNPLNPHALSRSMRRVASFSRATRAIEKELGKLGRAHGPRPRASSRGKRCGCK